MNRESQNIEWKESWHDDYLRWVCGFANAQGGIIVIGKKDDGTPVGLTNARKLLEDLPNKIRDQLGIMVDVNLVEENGLDLLEIRVEAYPNPISYKGSYYYRSGSTKQELKGSALDRFLLKKHGKTWDSVPDPRITEADLDERAIGTFRKRAAQSGRVEETALKDSDSELIEKLKLREGNYLNRAALILFYPHPERLITGAYIKIGFFRTDADLLFQDEVTGSLAEQVDRALDLLTTKYMAALIRYDGLQRIETLPYPRDALREALLNAVIHKDYATGNPVQISVYSDRLIFWNEGQLPLDWTLDNLTSKHPSRPYNPLIADVFFRMGMIEAWGRGIEKIRESCRIAEIPPPILRNDMGGIWIEFTLSSQPIHVSSPETSEKTSEKTPETSEKNPETSEKNPETSEKTPETSEKTPETSEKTSEKTPETSEKTPETSEKTPETSEKTPETSEKTPETSEKNPETSEKTSEKIILLVGENPTITIAELADKLGITGRSVERNIEKLKNEGKLFRIGPDKGGCWEVKT